MPSDPNFVRLANRLGLQMVADVTGGSGWSIGGLDVQDFPEDEEQAAYVRQQLGRGVLEPATQAEYDEVHDEDEMLEALSLQLEASKRTWQEAAVQDIARKRRRAVVDSREVDEEESEEELDDQRRQAIAEEQDELGLNTDDPEEQLSRVARGGVRTKKSTNAKKRSSQQRTRPEETPSE